MIDWSSVKVDQSANKLNNKRGNIRILASSSTTQEKKLVSTEDTAVSAVKSKSWFDSTYWSEWVQSYLCKYVLLDEYDGICVFI